MKRAVKIFVFITGVILLVSLLFSFSLLAEENEQISASGRFGELNWKFSKDSGILTVFGEGRMLAPATYDYWYTYAPFVSCIVIEDGAENIAGDIFSHSKNVESVTIPVSVIEIEENSFYINEYIVIKCNFGTYAEDYASENGITIEYLDIKAHGKCGENAEWKLDNKGVLTVFGHGMMDDYVYTDDIPWYSYIADIKHGVIEDGIKNIGQGTFYKCTALENVKLGKNIETVGIAAFAHCSSLTEVTLPEGLKRIEKQGFYECFELSELNIPKGVEKIGSHAFYRCLLLSDFVLPDTLESIEEYAFYECESLTEVVFPKALKSVGDYAYIACGALKYVNASGCNAVFGEYVFSGCNSLESADLPIDMAVLPVGTFAGCKALKDIELPSSIKTIEAYAFKNTVFSGILTLNIGLEYIDSNAFSYCELKRLYIPETVTGLGSEAFRDSRIDRIYITHDIKSIGNLAFWHTDGLIYCWSGSDMADYAKSNSCNYSYIDPGITYAQNKIIVKNLDCVKEILIAKGMRNDYEAVESNLIYRTGDKMLTPDVPYTYTVSDEGIFTVCAVYSNRNVIQYVKTDLSMPTFVENGLQLKIGNLTGVKLIRVAYGDYNTIGQISRAEGERSFTTKDVLNNKTEYTVQFRDEGLVTVAVRYNNGSVYYYKYYVTKKSPVMIVEDNMVTLKGLDDMKVLRYVRGEYSTSNQIKNAPGVVNIRAKDINASPHLKIALKSGTYTLCVQYNDESFNYYIITVE